MKFNNLAELVKAVSSDILYFEFNNKKKVPIDTELNLDITRLPEDENGDMAREDPDEFMRMLHIAVSHKLNHMYEEGFLEKKNGYYRVFSKSEIKKQLEELENNDD